MNTMMTENEARQLLLETSTKVLAGSDWGEGRLLEEFFTLFQNYDIYSALYVPDDALLCRLNDYREWKQGRRRENQGKLMEEIALLAFKCLRGFETEGVGSYQSVSAQHDLVVSGSNPLWASFIRLLHLPSTGRFIVVEAKNTKKTVSDAQFSRLCSIVQNQFDTLCHLGVFFSLKSASGFPKGKTKQMSFRFAKATQVLFHAKTSKFVIVLDDSDIELLDQPGILPKMLQKKIEEVEKQTGLQECFQDIKLQPQNMPSHLARYFG